jgi:hypothetical protein
MWKGHFEQHAIRAANRAMPAASGDSQPMAIMTKNHKPASICGVTGMICAALCIVAVACFVVFAITNRAQWAGWGGLVLLAMLVVLMQAVLAVGFFGVACSLVGIIRRETRKIVVTGLLMNVGVLLCLGIYFCLAFVIPTQKVKRDNARKREQYLATRTPEQHLFDAIAQQNLKEVESLLDHGVDSNITDSQGHRVLHVAIMNGSPEVVTCLLEHGAADDPKQPIALHLAATFGNLAMLKLFVAHGWDPNRQLDYYLNGTLVTPLDNAVAAGKTGRNKEVEIQYLSSLVVDKPRKSEQEGETITP